MEENEVGGISWRDWKPRTDGRFLIKQNGVGSDPFRAGRGSFCEHEGSPKNFCAQGFSTIPTTIREGRGVIVCFIARRQDNTPDRLIYGRGRIAGVDRKLWRLPDQYLASLSEKGVDAAKIKNLSNWPFMVWLDPAEFINYPRECDEFLWLRNYKIPVFQAGYRWMPADTWEKCNEAFDKAKEKFGLLPLDRESVWWNWYVGITEPGHPLFMTKVRIREMNSPTPHSNPGGGLVEWEDIAVAAARIFDVVSEQQPELEWAKTAWQHLREHGLTRYSTEVDWHVVQCRLLALGGIYQDFCQRAWDDFPNKPYESWAESMELDKFTLGRLYQYVENDSTNDDVGMYDAMESIVKAQRPAVVAAIQEGFGLEEGLISSLWSTRGDRDYFDSDDGDEIVPETGMSMSKLRALDWILGGCEPLG